jgi:hypothetical protein
MDLDDDLVAELRQNPRLAAVRFEPGDFIRTINAVYQEVKERRGATGEDDQDPPDDALAEEVGNITIGRLYQPDYARDFIFALYKALRADPRPDRLAGLLWGAWCLTDLKRKPKDNPLVQAVYDVTFEEITAGQNELEKLQVEQAGTMSPEEEYRAWQEKYAEFLGRHPLMDRLMSTEILDDAREALEAVRSGKINLRLPAWTMLGGLRYLLQATVALGYPRPSARLSRADKAHLASELEKVAWELDAGVFIPKALEALDGLVDSQGVPGTLSGSVRGLIRCLRAYPLEAQRFAFKTVYERALLTLIDTHPYPTGVDLELDALDFLDEERMLDYADALEADGQAEAAEHVRRVATRSQSSERQER